MKEENKEYINVNDYIRFIKRLNYLIEESNKFRGSTKYSTEESYQTEWVDQKNLWSNIESELIDIRDKALSLDKKYINIFTKL